MKYTVFYRSDGAIVSVVSEQENPEDIKVGTFYVPDGNILDGIDTSKKEHTALSHETPMSETDVLKAELDETKSRLEELNKKRCAEMKEMRQSLLAVTTMVITNSTDIDEDE